MELVSFEVRESSGESSEGLSRSDCWRLRSDVASDAARKALEMIPQALPGINN
jgi:hypothetical protein